MAPRKVEHTRSYLFMVRVWLEDLGNGKAEWRGQVKHVMSGEVRYFRDWATLIKHITTVLQTDNLSSNEEGVQP